MYASTNSASPAVAPIPTRSVGYAPRTAAALPPSAAPSPFGQDRFVPSSSYVAASSPSLATAPYVTAYASSPAYAPAAPASAPYAPTAYAPTPNTASTPVAAVPKILTLEDIPGTPERMKRLTKQVMAPYFETISQALHFDPMIAQAVAYGVQTDAEKLALVERVKAVVSQIYNLPPITTQILDEPWVGGGYSFDQNYLYSITSPLMNDATAGDLVYLTVHEMTHAFQHRMVSLPIRPGGELGELTDLWRGNTPQSHGYINYTDASNFERYAEQPLEFAAFLAGNFAEYQLTGANNRLWGTNETEAWDLYA